METLHPSIHVVLVDFDETLTRYHTGGALNLCQRDASCDHSPLLFLTDTGEHVPLHQNVAGGAANMYRWINDLVLGEGRWFGIITFADRRAAYRRQQQVHQFASNDFDYMSLGGDEMVKKWLWAIALASHNFDPVAADQSLNRLINTGRVGIVASLPEPSYETKGTNSLPAPNKRNHVRRIMSGFRSQGLNDANANPENVLVIDNTAYLLADLSQEFANIHIAHVPNGLDLPTWQTIVKLTNQNC